MVQTLGMDFTGQRYNVFTNNCNKFSDQFAKVRKKEEKKKQIPTMELQIRR
jgi:hypothetical protein